MVQENGTEFERLISLVLRISLLEQPDTELIEIGRNTWLAGTTLVVVATLAFGLGEGIRRPEEKHKTAIHRVVAISPVGRGEQPESPFFHDALQQIIVDHKTEEPIPIQWVDRDEIKDLIRQIPHPWHFGIVPSASITARNDADVSTASVPTTLERGEPAENRYVSF